MDVKNWDSKTALAALVFILYYLTLLVIAWSDIPEPRLDVVRDMLSVLGPLIGAAGLAIWRNSRADNIRAVADAEAAKTNAETVQLTAAAAPPVSTGDPWERRP